MRGAGCLAFGLHCLVVLVDDCRDVVCVLLDVCCLLCCLLDVV